MERKHLIHTIEPVFNQDSKVLLLGTFPSPKSREFGFYYSHPRNRFWPIIADLCSCNIPITKDEKIQFLLTHKIALWDVIEQCSIKGSSDASIHDVKASDIQTLLQQSPIERIFANGKTAGKLYEKWCEPFTCKSITTLPSTSPANAAYDMQRLLTLWSVIL